MRLPFLLLAAALSLGGCDLFGSEDTTIAVSGRAVTADGMPVVGLSVTLDRSATLGSVPEARTLTDSSGDFSIVFDPGQTNLTRTLYVNNDPYDTRYRIRQVNLARGERRDLGDINLSLPAAP